MDEELKLPPRRGKIWKYLGNGRTALVWFHTSESGKRYKRKRIISFESGVRMVK